MLYHGLPLKMAVQATLQTVYLMYTGSSDWIIVSSALFSFIMLTLSVTTYDGGFLGWSFSENTGHFLKLLLFRVLDVPPKILSIALLWYTGSGLTAFVVGMANISVGILVVAIVSTGYVVTSFNVFRHSLLFLQSVIPSMVLQSLSI